MESTPTPLLLAYVVAALAVLWIITANLAALARHRAGLDGRKASLPARFAWLLSVLAAWTGPLVVVGALVAIALGVREQRRVKAGEATRRSRLPAEMAVKNGIVLLAAAVVVALLIWLGWKGASPAT